MNNGQGSAERAVSTEFGRKLAAGLAEIQRSEVRGQRSGASPLLKRVWMVCWWFAPADVPLRREWHLEPVSEIVGVRDADVQDLLVRLGFSPKIAKRIGTTPVLSEKAEAELRKARDLNHPAQRGAGIVTEARS